MKDEPDDPLALARMKQAQGRGLKNSELTLLRHADNLRVFDSQRSQPPPTTSEGDTRTAMQAGKDTLASARGIDSALTARVGAVETTTATHTGQISTHTGQISTHTTNIAANATAITELTARVQTLETLVLNLTRQSVSYCTGGSTVTKTILMN